MRRFKITPEVILKGIGSFLFGAIVGFFAFRVVTHFSPNFVSAFTKKYDFYDETPSDEKEASYPDEKTIFPLNFGTNFKKHSLVNDAKESNAFLKRTPNIKPDSGDEEESSPVESAEEETSDSEESAPLDTEK